MRTHAIGAHVQKDGTLFRVWAPFAKKVEVLTPEAHEMQREDRGYYSLFVNGIKDRDLYKFRLNDQQEFPDPASRFQPEGVHGPSQVLDPEFPWTDQKWKGLPLEELVIYEFHVGSFTSQGTFSAVMPHLRRLKDLGVNAIEIMPVAQFPGTRNWGYDGVGLFAPQSSYGDQEISPVELKKLVNSCHEIGLAVILDVVYNHLGPEGNYLSQWGPYFQEKYRTPWGAAVNFDGPGSDEVRNFFLENARQWIEDYHMDGLRLDAIHAIVDMSSVPFLSQLSDLVHELGSKAGRTVHVIAESESNDSRILMPTIQGGLGMDAQWADDLHHAIHALLTHEHRGYYSDYGKAKQLAQIYKQGVLFQGEYSEYRQRSHGRSYKNISRHRLVVCTQNHDQVGNRAQGERLSTLTSKNKLKAGVAWVFLSGGLPLLFMGEEIAENAPFLYFVEPGDDKLLEAVREGRKNEFSEFHDGGDIPDPGSKRSLLKSRPRWERLQTDLEAREMHAYYKKLILLSKWIRKEKFFDSDHLQVRLSPDESLLSVEGHSSGEGLHMYFSLSETSQEIVLPQGKLEILFESEPFEGKTLKPFGVVVLREQK